MWGFHFVVQLVFLYLLQFILSRINRSQSLFFSFFFLLVSLIIEDLNFGDPDFQLKILFLATVVFDFCFLSETGWELVITTLSYIILHFLIGGLLKDLSFYIVQSKTEFSIYLSFKTKKKAKSLTSVLNEILVRVVLGKLAFLLVRLQFRKGNFTYSWHWPWLTTFTLQIIALNLFFFFFGNLPN